jgi:pantoate--beta-alanine ligase
MKVIKKVSELRNKLSDYRLSPVGMVPTMGALHHGHMTLVEKAIEKCPVIVVSIFVNPTQFNDKNDLKNYPRTLDNDLEMLGRILREKDIVFTPDVSEIYPEEDTRKFSFGNLDKVMEALHRPGHFNGVAQVVSRLFLIAEPDMAFFGIKDFQQLAVVKEMVRQLNLKVNIVPVDIVREKDGLAMSSRNRLLDPQIRKHAPAIYKTLSEVSEKIVKEDIPLLKNYVSDKLNSLPGFSVEYFEVADDIELIPLKSKSEIKPGRQYYGCIAVKAGNIRLIDNIRMKTTA